MDSKKRVARLAGLFYFVFLVGFIASAILRSKLIALGDAPLTATNISSHQWLFQLSIVLELISLFFFLAAAWSLYVLLKPLEKNIALSFLLLNLTGVAIECTSTLMLIAGSLVVRGDLNLLGMVQTSDSVIFLLKLYQNGFMVAQLFFSAWLLPLGYLVFRSTFLPRALGVLLMLDFFFWFLYFLQYFLFPDFKELSYLSFPIAIAAEFSLTLWLLIKGVRESDS